MMALCSFTEKDLWKKALSGEMSTTYCVEIRETNGGCGFYFKEFT